ncbi:class II D-tagatose-bisphosphate aldolase non-catalytic subunit [Paraburkholderia strydomiana]|uniref:class II D-tagatose-bisphosphate aldolase non-catalytic subunit n=1 Tax=Paraburkholderia strydomiana TaxID=1245417 RepID=UPI0035B540C0
MHVPVTSRQLPDSLVKHWHARHTGRHVVLETATVHCSAQYGAVGYLRAIAIHNRPGNSEKYYDGGEHEHEHEHEHEQRILCAYSYSDRLRYYSAVPRIGAAVQKLVGSLAACAFPRICLAATCSRNTRRCAAGSLAGRR